MSEEADWGKDRSLVLSEMKRLGRLAEQQGERLASLPHVERLAQDVDERVGAIESVAVPEVRQLAPKVADLELRVRAAELALNGLAVRIAIFSGIGGFVAATAMAVVMKLIQ